MALDLQASDDLSGVASAWIGVNDPGLEHATQVTFAHRVEWWIPSGPDPVTVYVRFADRAGNYSVPCSVSIER